MCHRSRRDSCLEDLVEWIDERIEFLRHWTTQGFLPQSEIKERSGVRRYVVSPCESFTCFWCGLLEKDMDKCKVESLAYEWIGHWVRLRRSLMNNSKRVSDKTEPCGAPLLIGLREPSTLTFPSSITQIVPSSSHPCPLPSTTTNPLPLSSLFGPLNGTKTSISLFMLPIQKTLSNLKNASKDRWEV